MQARSGNPIIPHLGRSGHGPLDETIQPLLGGPFPGLSGFATGLPGRLGAKAPGSADLAGWPDLAEADTSKLKWTRQHPIVSRRAVPCRWHRGQRPTAEWMTRLLP